MHSLCVITSIFDEFHPMITLKQNQVFRNQNLLDVSPPRIILLTKHVSFVGRRIFRVLPQALHAFLHFHGLSLLDTYELQKIPGLSHEGISIPSCNYPTQVFMLCEKWNSAELHSMYQAHSSTTKDGMCDGHALTPMNAMP